MCITTISACFHEEGKCPTDKQAFIIEANLAIAFVVKFFRTTLGIKSFPGDFFSGSLLMMFLISDGDVGLKGNSAVKCVSFRKSVTSVAVSLSMMALGLNAFS